jgi:hypothetical protein
MPHEIFYGVLSIVLTGIVFFGAFTEEQRAG